MLSEKICEDFFIEEVNSTFNDDSWSIKSNQIPTMASFRWTKEENFLYLSAVKRYKEQLSSSEAVRRRTKVFKKMEKMLHMRRSSQQIRGHHKKMILKYHTTEKLIKNLESSLSKERRTNRDKEQIKKEEKSMKIQDIENAFSSEEIHNWSQNWWKSIDFFS